MSYVFGMRSRFLDSDELTRKITVLLTLLRVATLMGKHTISLHLSEPRKTKLDQLISHSKYEGHGSQMDTLRLIIDNAASRHPEIDSESPQIPEATDEQEYHPQHHSGLLSKERVKEVLNTQSPAIDPTHVPPAWMPRNKISKAVLVAAYYRFYEYIRCGDEPSLDEALEITSVGDSEERREYYQEEVSNIIERYGSEPSNVDSEDTGLSS